MSELIVYATHKDADEIRTWINGDADIAWIVKVTQEGNSHEWRAVESIDSISEQSYALWHIGSEPLNIPSGHRDIPDAIVANPFQGWSQTLETARATAPWFGSALPGPYLFRFVESGREASRSLGRSDSPGLWIDIRVLANRPIRMRSAGGHDFAVSWRNHQLKLFGPALLPRVPTYFLTHFSKSIKGVLAT